MCTRHIHFGVFFLLARFHRPKEIYIYPLRNYYLFFLFWFLFLFFNKELNETEDWRIEPMEISIKILWEMEHYVVVWDHLLIWLYTVHRICIYEREKNIYTANACIAANTYILSIKSSSVVVVVVGSGDIGFG